MPFVKRHRTYYKYGTEPNASIVGSFARIDEGVASGFTSANYLSLPETFTIGASDSFEIVVSFVHKTQSSIGYILGASTDATLGVIINSSNKVQTSAGNGSSWYGDLVGTTVLTYGVKYWVKLVRDTSGWYLYLSTDGKEYNLEKSNTWSGAPRSTNIYIGNVYGGKPFLGNSIDLSQSYININGSRWWSGDSYTKVGSWIDDGVVSGFTTGNYLTLPEVFTPSSNTWEQVYKITTSSDVSTTQIFVGNGGAANKIMFGVQSGNFKLWLSSNNSTWNVADASAGSYTVLSSTEYYIRLKFTGTSYTLEYSLNGNEDSYATDITVSSSALITNSNALSFGANQYSSGVNHPFSGSIDLNQSYIKINNKDWWHGTKAYQVNLGGEDVYEDWTQPVLSANGTLGGNKFAVVASSNYSGWEAWEAFDGVLTGDNGWSASANTYPQHIIFYNPVELLVKKLTIINHYEGNVAFTAGNVYGSNNGSSWTLITSYTNDNTTSDASWDIILDENKTLYKYHKLEITNGNFISTNLPKCTEVLITAQTLKAVGGDDYDYYVNHNKLYQLATVKRSYWKYQDWTQPNNMTSAGTMGGDNFAVNQSSALNASSYFYYAFDDASTYAWHSAAGLPQWVSWYNPKPLKVTKLYFAEQSAGQIKDFIIQACNDNSSWIDILSYSNTVSGAAFEVDLSSNDKAYKYWRIYITSCYYYSGGNPYPLISRGFTITAQEPIESTSTDYDYYTDKLISYDILNPNNYYKFTINPTPADATVTINGKNVNTVRLIKNSRIVWSVSAEGYAEQSGELRLSEDTVMDVVLEECAYVTDQVVFESATAGTYDVELLENGNYEVYCIAGGSGGAYVQYRSISGKTAKASAGGGSGSGFIGVVLLEKSTYNIKVGEGGAATYTKDSSRLTGTTGGNSYINDLIVTYGGGAASVRGNNSDNRSGAGGSAPAVNVEIVSTTLNASGKSGSKDNSSVTDVAGGASVYEGYGAGGRTKSNGTSGYVKIVWKG